MVSEKAKKLISLKLIASLLYTKNKMLNNDFKFYNYIKIIIKIIILINRYAILAEKY